MRRRWCWEAGTGQHAAGLHASGAVLTALQGRVCILWASGRPRALFNSSSSLSWPWFLQDGVVSVCMLLSSVSSLKQRSAFLLKLNLTDKPPF